MTSFVEKMAEAEQMMRKRNPKNFPKEGKRIELEMCIP